MKANLILIALLLASAAANVYQHAHLKTYKENAELIASAELVRIISVEQSEYAGDNVQVKFASINPRTGEARKDTPVYTQLVSKSPLLKNGVTGRLVVNGFDFKRYKPYFTFEQREHTWSGSGPEKK
ncbi:MAG TPA: hypothetical protein VGE35_03850 [Candidatus Paceibacterota bacterium]